MREFWTLLGTSTTCSGDTAPSLGSPVPWRGWFLAIFLALLSDLFSPFPDFLWRRGSWESMEKLEGRTQVLKKPEAKICICHALAVTEPRPAWCWRKLLLLLVCFCGAHWNCGARRNWPFTCPSCAGWLKCWAIVLGTDYALTVWLKYFHCADAGRWVDFGMLLPQLGELLFSFFGWYFAFSICNTDRSPRCWNSPEPVQKLPRSHVAFTGSSQHWYAISVKGSHCPYHHMEAAMELESEQTNVELKLMLRSVLVNSAVEQP